MSTQQSTIQSTGFQDAGSIPEARADLSSLAHYGCSPAFDIRLYDRDVGHKEVEAQALLLFKNLPYFIKDDDGENPAPDASGHYEVPPGMTAHVKTARACAEEMRHAYAVTNPWGFCVFDSLTGLEPHIARRIFQTVLPHRMNFPRLVDHLEIQAVGDIQTAGFPDGITNPYTQQTAEECAEAVRLTLLKGIREVEVYARETLDASGQEMAERRAGGRGKPKADRNDERLAAFMGEPVPTPTSTPAPQPKDDLARAITRQTEAIKSLATPQGPDLAALQEQVARLTATIEELQSAKKGK